MKLKLFLTKCIDFYQKHLTGFLKPSCVFYPTCSEYTKAAINKYGAGKGIYLGLRRILRCHPWQKSQIDPVK